ncbi:class I adenylate cyclase [Methylococcus sp. EFPC2]|uniref:class I adenylate cyclase n=1 Tax=Methylococcus sp. EFPC2 TaxID=2812648 RepID=UPI0019687854|nr:class I adenylate cyclase [Methylococcus sp. EFPC2]QSA95880.1 class I adenylate cyclase [Methylococcus sp. EFPC2]
MKLEPLRPIVFGRPGEEIGKKDLAAIVQRFKNLHKLQLQRIQAQLSQRQRDFLELLPLLLHVNHPLLPGYVDSETPAGIPDYLPSRQTLLRAARLSRSFEFKRRALPHHPIQGLFLMGSVGSIAYTRKSDLDIWLCHGTELTGDELDALRRKAQLLEQWAETLQLEAHIFFIDPVGFRAGHGEPISTESCGSIQHHLLLEEFYRTSLYLAGRAPAWWLVPPEQDPSYTEYLSHLLEKRFVAAGELIDFGGLEHVAAGEFLGGTLWHLYKAIGSPHKSLLKLLLMEVYAGEFPQPEWLCTRLKSAVYSGSVEPAELDSYILMYRKVEAYLRQRREYDRLELVQQCFYLKINEVLSVPAVSSVEKRYRRDVLQALIGAWGWSPARLRELDAQRRCRIAQALEEHRRIGKELTQGYRNVSQFAREHGRSMRLENDEIILLGRRLYAAIEHKPGKVEQISQDMWEELLPEDLCLQAHPAADDGIGWELRTGGNENAEPLARARNLLEILAWLSLNGFYGHRSRLSLENAAASSFGMFELKSCMYVLADFLRRYLREQASLDAYAAAPRIDATALFINLEGGGDGERRDGLVITSNRFDPLSFGSGRVSLVATVDHLKLTSWQELLVERRYGLDGLFDCFCEILNKRGPGSEAPAFECHSFGSSRSQNIVLRIRELFGDLTAIFMRKPTARYVARGGEAFYVFERRDGSVRYRIAADPAGLMAMLAEPNPVFAPVEFDRLALENSPLPAVYEHNQEGVIQIFCRPETAGCEVYILDERGSLFFRLHRGGSPQRLFAGYALFFSAVQRHTVTAAWGLEFFLLEGGRGSEWRAHALDERPVLSGRQLPLRIFGSEIEPGRTAFTIQCDDQEFSSMEWGDQVFARAAEHILTLRKGGERYPIHVTDIDAPPEVLGAPDIASLQSVHFLNYKRKVEERLQV